MTSCRRDHSIYQCSVNAGVGVPMRKCGLFCFVSDVLGTWVIQGWRQMFQNRASHIRVCEPTAAAAPGSLLEMQTGSLGQGWGYWNLFQQALWKILMHPAVWESLHIKAEVWRALGFRWVESGPSVEGWEGTSWQHRTHLCLHSSFCS